MYYSQIIRKNTNLTLYSGIVLSTLFHQYILKTKGIEFS